VAGQRGRTGRTETRRVGCGPQGVVSGVRRAAGSQDGTLLGKRVNKWEIDLAAIGKGHEAGT